ncbi:hypothetical protein [Lysobacter capsici]|uniref:hypothetical protein n=1 Tax=Lysobacter capsici TaxID=435897 RepID=UPI001290154F|nr:hypothetical protein [Lysobacter capsici]
MSGLRIGDRSIEDGYHFLGFFGFLNSLLELQGFQSYKQDQRLPPLKRRVTFFCLKQQKKGNQRKVLFCESRARKLGAYAGMRHTGHPVPVAHGAHPCAPPFGCAVVLASSERRSAG